MKRFIGLLVLGIGLVGYVAYAAAQKDAPRPSTAEHAEPVKEEARTDSGILQSQERETTTVLRAEVYNLIDVTNNDTIGPIYHLSPITATAHVTDVTDQAQASERIVIVWHEQEVAVGSQADAEDAEDVEGKPVVAAAAPQPIVAPAAASCGGLWKCPPGSSPPSPNCSFTCGGTCTKGVCGLITIYNEDGSSSSSCQCFQIY